MPCKIQRLVNNTKKVIVYNKLHTKYWKQEGKRGAFYLVYDSIL